MSRPMEFVAATALMLAPCVAAQQPPLIAPLQPAVARRQAVLILEQAGKFLSAAPDVYWSYPFRLAVQLSRAGNHDAAMAELQKTMEVANAQQSRYPHLETALIAAFENQWPSGDHDGLRLALPRIVEMAAAESGDPSGVSVIRRAAALEAKIGDPERARQWLATIPPDSGQYPDVLGDEAALRVKGGDLAGARKLASDKEEMIAARISSRIVDAQVEAADWSGADESATSISHALFKAEAFAKIGEARARTGDATGAAKEFARALDIAAQPPRWEGAMTEVAVGEARMGDFTGAMQIVKSEQKSTTQKPVDLARIASIAADAGEHDVARNIAAFAASLEKDLAEKDRTVLAASQIAAVQADVSDYEGAMATASLVPESSRQYVLLQISKEQAKLGDVAAAERTLAETPFGSRPSEHIVEAKAKKGDFNGALKAAANVMNYREQVLCAMAGAGHVEEALQIATQPNNPVMKVDLLIATARGLLDAADEAERKAQRDSNAGAATGAVK